MKTRALISVFAIALHATCIAEESAQTKVKNLTTAVAPKDWKLVSDGRIFTLSVPKVRLLNPISLPAFASEDEIWKEFSWESDFVVVIRVTSKIDDAEYAALLKLRSETITRRILEWEKKRGERINGKSRWGLVREVHETIQIPYCHNENKSVWILSTDNELLKTRPKVARDVADGLRAGLAREFTLYANDREQGGADQPATAPKAKPEGDSKPQPKLEGRSQ